MKMFKPIVCWIVGHNLLPETPGYIEQTKTIVYWMRCWRCNKKIDPHAGINATQVNPSKEMTPNDWAYIIIALCVLVFIGALTVIAAGAYWIYLFVKVLVS